MALQLFANNATGYLNTAINDSVTSIVLQSGQGAKFPSPTGGDYFLVTLYDGASTVEICKCTARSSDTLTVTRAQEGTTAAAFPAGAICENRATKGTLENSVQLVGNQTIAGTKTFSDPTTMAGANNSGNLTFTGTGNRITGDFSNATTTSRVSFQSSTTNGATVVQLIPNGTSTSAQFSAYGGSDILNTSVAQLTNNGTEVRIASGIFGTGTYLPMTFYTGGSERMRVDTSGNVGIGTSSPDSKLAVYNATGTSQIRFGASSSYYWDISRDNDTTGNLWFSNYNASGSRTTRMVIDTSGNVGIGTALPYGELDVTRSKAGAVTNLYVKNPDNTGGAAVRVNSQTDAHQAVLGITDAGGGGRVGTITNDYFYFVTNNTERARFDSSGRVCINTTSPIAGDGAFLNSLVGSSGMSFAFSSTGTGLLGRFYANTTVAVGSITVTGSATAYNTSSDYRLKENVQPMQNALGIVAQLNPVTYTWKADGSDGQGFIAHELQAVVPDCVTGEKDEVDSEGKPVYQGIDTSFLVATLTAAIQEQQALIKSLAARVAALEGAAA